MSFAVTAVEAIVVNGTLAQPPSGATFEIPVTAGETQAAITDPATKQSPAVIEIRQQFVQEAGSLFTLAMATAGASVTLDGTSLSASLSTTDKIRITVGKDENGNFLQIGGMVIRGNSARGITVDLGGGLATLQVPPENIPPVFKKIFQFGLSRASLSNALQAPSLNTATELSLGNDSYLGTEFNDGIVLSLGNDVMVGGGGDDVFAANASLKGAKSKITLDGSGGNAGAGGSDQVVLAKGALKEGKAKIILSDFNSKQDVIGLETKRSKVTGLGTDQLKISTKNGKLITIESDGSKFSKGSVEFI